MLELDAGIRVGKAPVDADGGGVARLFPGRDFCGEVLLVVQAFGQALAGEDREFDLSHVQPGAVLGRVVDLQPFGQPATRTVTPAPAAVRA